MNQPNRKPEIGLPSGWSWQNIALRGKAEAAKTVGNFLLSMLFSVILMFRSMAVSELGVLP